MEKISGKTVFKGIAIGEIKFVRKEDAAIKRMHITDSAAEYERVLKAKEDTIEQLKALYEKTKQRVGEAEAAIFEVHQFMLEDDDYLNSIHNMIETENINAEYAVARTSDNFSSMFEKMQDEYMRARAADVRDVSSQLINMLLGKTKSMFELKTPKIIVADDLSPSETVQMDRKNILAIVVKQGSANSHTAILARTMGIPAMIGADFADDIDGKCGIVDGEMGLFWVEPEETIIEEYSKKYEEQIKRKGLFATLRGKETVTKSGKKINLYANIGNSSDVALVLENDGEGVGLFRSEFIFLGRSTSPGEEEQFQIYKEAAQNMAGKKMIIRTLDIGADKQVDYLGLKKEENPALGFRAIRICLNKMELFKTQLRAILRASVFGNISIMYPMIISVDEVIKIKKIVNEIEKEFESENCKIGKIEQGIMIETPAAVMMSRELAAEVDFFSIGTNDLTQYTLAIDRQNPELENYYDPHHPAILKMIKMVIENAHKENCWVGICGELGADTQLTKTFIDMGVDELSVSPSYILPIRKIIRELE